MYRVYLQNAPAVEERRAVQHGAKMEEEEEESHGDGAGGNGYIHRGAAVCFMYHVASAAGSAGKAPTQQETRETNLKWVSAQNKDRT